MTIAHVIMIMMCAPQATFRKKSPDQLTRLTIKHCVNYVLTSQAWFKLPGTTNDIGVGMQCEKNMLNQCTREHMAGAKMRLERRRAHSRVR